MAAYFPQSIDSLMNIHVVGKVKSEKFGKAFLSLIASYCTEHNIAEQHKTRHISQAENPTPTAATGSGKPRHVVVGEMANSGRVIADIMAEFGIKRRTVIDHLWKFVSQGNRLDTEAFSELSKFSNHLQQSVFKAFDRYGAERLKPVFDDLNGAVGYDDLQLLRLCYVNRHIDRKSIYQRRHRRLSG